MKAKREQRGVAPWDGADDWQVHLNDLLGRADRELAQHFPGTRFEIAGARSPSRPLFIWWEDGPLFEQVQATLTLDVGFGLYREPSLVNLMTLAAGLWVSADIPVPADEKVVTFDYRQADPQLVEFARLVLVAGGVSRADATYEDLYDAASRAIALSDMRAVLEQVGDSVASAAGLDLAKLVAAGRPVGVTADGPVGRGQRASTVAGERSR
jgi:hypothetical protein